jgi:hypothetical protein
MTPIRTMSVRPPTDGSGDGDDIDDLLALLLPRRGCIEEKGLKTGGVWEDVVVGRDGGDLSSLWFLADAQSQGRQRLRVAL